MVEGGGGRERPALREPGGRGFLPEQRDRRGVAPMTEGGQMDSSTTHEILVEARNRIAIHGWYRDLPDEPGGLMVGGEGDGTCAYLAICDAAGQGLHDDYNA